MEFKPTRVLIHVVGAIPESFLKEISPRSVNFRRFAKIPMVMILFDGSIMVGLNLIFFKFVQVLLEDGSPKDSWPLITILLIIALLMAVLGMHFVNMSVRYYDQTDVVPIYNASILVTEMLSGLIVGGEFHLYNSSQLIGIFAGSIVCVLGI